MASSPLPAVYDDDSDDNERGLVPYTSQAPRYQSVQPQGFLMPLGDIEEARAAIAAYEALKTAIVRPDDIQKIQGRDFLKKSFWRRVAACFGLSLELVREERLNLDGKLAYRATYRAVAPNGRTMDGDGMCLQGEKGQMIEHNIRAIAHTRAKNRAISDLVGGGEVSAEEMPEEDERPHAPARPAGKTATPAPWNALKDSDIGLTLQQMGRKDEAERRGYLELLYREMTEEGVAWTKPNLQKRLKTEREKATTTPGSLEDLPVGTRGN